MIDPITIPEGGHDAPSRKAIARKVNEIVEVVNSWTEPTQAAPVEVTVGAEIKPAAEEAEELSFMGFVPLNGDPKASYFNPPKNYVDPTDGTPISGVIKRSDLPQPVLAYFESYGSAEQPNG